MAAGVLTAALTEAAIVTYRDVKQEKILPLPSSYTSVAVVYGLLALFPDSAAPFPALVGWGLVVATLLNLWNPAGGLKPAPRATTPTTQGATP